MAPRPNSSRRSYRPALIRVVTLLTRGRTKAAQQPGWAWATNSAGAELAQQATVPNYTEAPAPRHSAAGEPPPLRTAFLSNIAPCHGSVNAGEVQCSGIAMAKANTASRDSPRF